MTLNRDVDYIDYLYTCNRCRSCTVDNTFSIQPTCPSYNYFGFFTYSGGGKAYTCQGILEETIELSQETASVAMNCLLCGGCAKMCPPGFDTLSFIRDLRDLHVKNGHYINDAHKTLLEKARAGKIWGDTSSPDNLPIFNGSQEMLVFLGSRERARRELSGALKTILDTSGITWGILEDEPDSGASLEDLGDLTAFQEQAEKNIELFNSSGAERMVV
ncbi:MAG: (Fe-S)-binding protein, partial [Desulfobacterales bacterium]|nr:(Fe-S)-binding protein [Desulfobacterales bacterium]